jgi:hypothetical protein
MKTFLEKGLVYFAVTVFVAIAAIVIGLIGIGLILTAAGNLSFWPALGSVLLGAFSNRSIASGRCAVSWNCRVPSISP